MFDIFEEVFLDSDLLIPAIFLVVIGFLLSEFKANKFNTKLVISAVLVMVYVISSFLINIISSYLANFIFLFLGGFSISLFFGFAINIIFRLIKRKD